MTKIKILFLCTGNSCRSQMAEGWCRELKSGEMECDSAGVVRHGLDPKAVKAMAESGVDISDQKSKTVEDLADREYDYVVTLCDHARQTCPSFPGEVVTVHRGFDDPPSLAMGVEDEEEAMRVYRRVRDEIREFVADMPANLPEATRGPDLSVSF